MGTKMCRISVRTPLVFTTKVDISEIWVLFLKNIFQIGEQWPPGAPGLGLAPAPALALALTLGGPGVALGCPGGPWALALGLALWPILQSGIYLS